MKRAYYYFFYNLYKIMLWTSSPFENFYSKFRASLALIALELWVIFTIQNCYEIVKVTDSKSNSNLFIYIMGLAIIISNYVLFDYYDHVWKKYKGEFDKWSKRKNKIGGIIVWIIILCITVSFFFSTFYLHKINFGTY
ncbi:hypothetical protein VUJ46_02505 [Chryseobacterium sp. MYb264]|uniref:hypothetical protein n=1 Tax=Chryseobacterium sp. MYb264 TaxID=2745153 RepID=UPI002E0D2B8B|nr:hypothetical protein VUJ46_02505 [Chryseobacterium sp. MYb264]